MTVPKSSLGALVLGEWILVASLMIAVAWTTLALGGYLAETMIVTSWAIFGLVAFGGFLWVANASRGSLKFNWSSLIPVPFLIYALMSVCWIAPAKWLAWREWLLWVQMWLVFVLILHFGRGRAHTRLIVGMLAFLGVVGTAMAAYQRFNDPSWLMLGRTQAEQFFERSSGMFGSPNSLAGFLELMIPACLTLLFSRATTAGVKVVCAWLAGLFILGFVLTGSRGGWLALGLTLLLWPWFAGRNWRRRLAGATLALLLVAVGMASAFHFSENVRTRLQPFLEGRFEVSRPLLWRSAIEIWGEHPVFGGGASSYNVLFDQFRPRGFLDTPVWTHNDYLNTLSDYGGFGFILWLGAGVWLFHFGWRAVRRARRENFSSTNPFQSWQWRMGLFLGLLAYVFHLAVDFHTKVPALAYVFALVFALLLRDEPSLQVTTTSRGWPAWSVALISLFLGWRLADPLYRAEALRYEARRSIDRYAKTGKGELWSILPKARANLERAATIYPANGQTWADLSYATVQSWRVSKDDLLTSGKQAQDAAERALSLCPVDAQFWIRKGIALDMQALQADGGRCFRRALELAPNTPGSWYHYAYHLQTLPSGRTGALQALATCLALDPSNAAAITLRDQLIVPPN